MPLKLSKFQVITPKDARGDRREHTAPLRQAYSNSLTNILCCSRYEFNVTFSEKGQDGELSENVYF